MFHIEARIDHNSVGVGCFDPIQVICRMRVALPEMRDEWMDHLWQTCNFMRKAVGPWADGALRIAVRDLQERGPCIRFTIPISATETISGHAERYWVGMRSEDPFPEQFKERMMTFLKSLTMQTIEVRSFVLTDGDTESDV